MPDKTAGQQPAVLFPVNSGVFFPKLLRTRNGEDPRYIESKMDITFIPSAGIIYQHRSFIHTKCIREMKLENVSACFDIYPK